MERILLIEDEDSLRKIVHLNLEMESYEVISIPDGEQALKRLSSEYFDLIILDLMIPKINGLDVLKSFRTKNPEIPVIIISAKDTSGDRILGLKTGADDYLSKPFEFEELLIRVQNLLKRKVKDPSTENEDEFNFGVNHVNFKTFEAFNSNGEFNLRPKEVFILRYLINNKNQVVSRQDILKAVWGYDVYPSTRTIDNFIASLRKHFEADPKNPQYIVSIHGIGYKFISP